MGARAKGRCVHRTEHGHVVSPHVAARWSVVPWPLILVIVTDKPTRAWHTMHSAWPRGPGANTSKRRRCARRLRGHITCMHAAQTGSNSPQMRPSAGRRALVCEAYSCDPLHLARFTRRLPHVRLLLVLWRGRWAGRVPLQYGPRIEAPGRGSKAHPVLTVMIALAWHHFKPVALAAAHAAVRISALEVRSGGAGRCSHCAHA